MIEASIGAVPGLLLSFGILALILGVPTAVVARMRRKAVLVRVLCAASVAGIVTVTLLPTEGGPVGQKAICDASAPWPQLLQSSSAWLNVALFVPVAFFAVLVFRRPLTVAVGAGVASGAVEFVQAVSSIGRSCSTTDLVANTTGALLGSLAAMAWLRGAERGTWQLRKDIYWGAALASVGCLTLTVMFQSQVTSYTPVSERPGLDAEQQQLIDADDWISEAATDVFGDQVQVEQTAIEKRAGHRVVTAITDQGEISGWWPEKKLEQAAFTDNKAEPGPLGKEQATVIGARFAEKWFSEEVRGAKRTVRVSGTGDTAVYMISYRRYSKGLMMPLRLNVTVTSAGRILNFTARAVKDPVLPAVTITRDRAAQLAHEATGKSVEAAVLLAQNVKHEGWRPVWMMGVGNSDVFIDAANGQQIAPQDLIRP